MQNYINISYDYLVHGDRRKGERRLPNLERRGVLRWDPQTKERRLSRDRRQVARGR